MRANMPPTGHRQVNEKPFKIAINSRESAPFHPLDLQKILIKDRHEGYISWEQFERNQRLIADNANGKSYMGRGSIRRGEALLAGLLRCARCGRRLAVAYSGTGGATQRYVCRGTYAVMAEN